MSTQKGYIRMVVASRKNAGGCKQSKRHQNGNDFFHIQKSSGLFSDKNEREKTRAPAKPKEPAEKADFPIVSLWFNPKVSPEAK